MKTMILGYKGMLANELINVFPNSTTYSHQELDITNRNMVLKTIKQIQPSVVINAAAYTNVDGCEDDPEMAFDVNGYGTGYIAEACSNVGVKLIHFSTDYVFDGAKKEYTEKDQTNPINVYGKSKLLGEELISENIDNYRIIRTSWLFGAHGKNFVDTILGLSEQMDTVKVVDDQFGKPTYAADLAQKTAEIIEMEPGIYHITNEGVCSWYEFASAVTDNVVPCSSDEFLRKAKRPRYSVLANTKTAPLRHWRLALVEYLKQGKAGR